MRPLAPERSSKLQALQERLGYHFGDLALLDQALTHSSCAHESLSDQTRHNEPLEFLGDAVIGFVVSDLLHRREPEGKEGAKSKARARLVAAPSLARKAAELGLPDLLLLGRGEEKTGGRKKANLWADAYEAVIAALYLDGGIEAVSRFLAAEFASDLERPPDPAEQDWKSALQEHLQARGDPVPEYLVVGEEGPSHQRRFRVRCLLQGTPVAEGEGLSKKLAQQEAARRALELAQR